MNLKIILSGDECSMTMCPLCALKTNVHFRILHIFFLWSTSCVWFRNIHFQRESKQRRISVMTTCLSILCIPMEGQDDDNDYGNLIQNEEHQHKD